MRSDHLFLGSLLEYSQIKAVVEEFTAEFEIAIISVTTIEMALNLAALYQYSYFDSLILASALEVGIVPPRQAF